MVIFAGNAAFIIITIINNNNNILICDLSEMST